MGTGPVIWGIILPASTIAGWYFARRPLRLLLDGMRFDQARVTFRHEREWLEARFLRALALSDPMEAIRWDDAQWLSPVRWARDRQTHRLFALVGVEFDVNPFDETSIRHATAFFEYRKGRWFAEGKHVDALRPDETIRQHARYEVVVPPEATS